MRRSWLCMCALVGLAPVLLCAGEGTQSAADAPAQGVPAVFAWGDMDGDGRLEVASVNADGTLQLLAGVGEDRFEDVGERVGLAGIEDAALALWVDYDADGRLDLFVGARTGASRLFRNEGGVFVDMTAGAGLALEGGVQSADWLDHDGDGRADLHVVTAEGHELYRGLEGGFFERAQLPVMKTGDLPQQSSVVLTSTPHGTGAPDSSSAEDGPISGSSLPPHVDGARSSSSRVPLGPSPSAAGATPIVLLPGGCAASIQDQSNPGTCLGASTTPALGKLYPLSTNLFVAVGGNVGIGTTSPSAKLHVAGPARITDTLTLAPGGNPALDFTGDIYMGGDAFIHTGGLNCMGIGEGAAASVSGIGDDNIGIGAYALHETSEGTDNTAVGAYALRNNDSSLNTAMGTRALSSNTTGGGNTAVGWSALRNSVTGSGNTACGNGALYDNVAGYANTATGQSALRSNTTGASNMASGAFALQANTIGAANTACGSEALQYNTTGTINTASGFRALRLNTTGFLNTASGYLALSSNTSGNRNIALGTRAGRYLTTGSDNIDIGNDGVAGESATIRIGAFAHTRTFIAGIRGVTTGNTNAIPVLIDSAGQLGTVSSSRRFKEDIADMGDRTERLLELRPVVFRYKPEQALPDGSEVPLEYGLIAEEVAEVFPDLVVNGEDGQPFTVKYHLLSAMLLNELMELHEQVQEQSRTIGEQSSELARLRQLEARVDALEAEGACPGAH